MIDFLTTLDQSKEAGLTMIVVIYLIFWGIVQIIKAFKSNNDYE